MNFQNVQKKKKEGKREREREKAKAGGKINETDFHDFFFFFFYSGKKICFSGINLQYSINALFFL